MSRSTFRVSLVVPSLVLFFSLFLGDAAFAASDMFLRLDGVNGAVPALAIKGIVSPRDPASGLPTGKRMHKPFVIVKEWDAQASAVVVRGWDQKKNIRVLAVHFSEKDAAGRDVVESTYTFTDVTVLSVAKMAPPRGTPAGAIRAGQDLEEITFDAASVVVTGKTMAEDSWTTRRVPLEAWARTPVAIAPAPAPALQPIGGSTKPVGPPVPTPTRPLPPIAK